MNVKIKYVANAVRWFDKVNGNTYHSVKVTRVKDGAELKSSLMVYGYGNQFESTAIVLMAKNGWIDKKYIEKNVYFLRENDYCILWNVNDGLKRDMYNNVR